MSMSQEPQSDFFFTSDLGLVTTLTLNGHPIQEINRSDSHRAVFVFRQCAPLNKLMVSYFNNDPTLTVRPQVFFNQLRDVKARLYGER